MKAYFSTPIIDTGDKTGCTPTCFGYDVICVVPHGDQYRIWWAFTDEVKEDCTVADDGFDAPHYGDSHTQVLGIIQLARFKDEKAAKEAADELIELVYPDVSDCYYEGANP